MQLFIYKKCIKTACMYIACNETEGLSFLCRIVGLWRTEVAKTNEKAAESIADPLEYENLFPGLSQTVQAEKVRNVHPVCSLSKIHG